MVGGSLGSGTLNRAMQHWIQDGCPGGENLEVIWQCGKYYKKEIDAFMEAHPDVKGIRHYDFIGRMDLAYAAADVVISRAGAMSISELALVQKPVIFVPLPTAAEDHQPKNAQQLVDAEAALMVRNAEAEQELVPALLRLKDDRELQAKLSENIGKFARPNAADDIVDQIIKAIEA